MYQSFRDQISKEITTSFDAALSGPYSLFIDDRPTGTGKTYQLPYLTRIAEKHGIKRSFILTPQKEQRDELSASISFSTTSRRKSLLFPQTASFSPGIPSGRMQQSRS